MFSQQHYKAIAEVFNKTSATNRMFFIVQLAKMFELDNPKFDMEKFLTVCYGSSEGTITVKS